MRRSRGKAVQLSGACFGELGQPVPACMHVGGQGLGNLCGDSLPHIIFVEFREILLYNEAGLKLVIFLTQLYNEASLKLVIFLTQLL